MEPTAFEKYVSPNKFKDVYEQAGQTCAALREFINCLRKYEKCKVVNREPDNLSSCNQDFKVKPRKREAACKDCPFLTLCERAIVLKEWENDN